MHRVILALLVGLLSWTPTANAQDRPKVGVLKLTASAPAKNAYTSSGCADCSWGRNGA